MSLMLSIFCSLNNSGIYTIHFYSVANQSEIGSQKITEHENLVVTNKAKKIKRCLRKVSSSSPKMSFLNTISSPHATFGWRIEGTQFPV